MNNYRILYIHTQEIMNVIAINGQEITLGCFVNLHEKTVYTYNGIFTKISNIMMLFHMVYENNAFQ